MIDEGAIDERPSNILLTRVGLRVLRRAARVLTSVLIIGSSGILLVLIGPICIGLGAV